MRTLVLRRAVTVEECPWLDRDLPAGTLVWTYDGPTYGVVSGGGIAVSARAAESPFFELPVTAFTEEK